MKVMLWASMIGLGAIAVAAYWFGTREGRNQVAEMQRLLAQAESTSTALRARASTGDTTLANTLQRQMDSLRAQAREAANGSDQQIAAATAAIEQHTFRQQNLVKMDMVTIAAVNDRAVAFLITEIDGESKGGTAFGVTNGGLMITNRHNVRSEATQKMTANLSVIFSGSSARLRARVVKVFEDIDLALIQIENEGVYPTVQGISAKGDVAVGAAAAVIGFPLSLGLPMDGNKMTSTLTPGTVSKRIPSLLQLDAYGAHGMSGSPVFDSRGLVVGVVYGGPKDAPQIIYAVPSDRVAAALGDAAKGIVR
jgi:S1-C subfamily serine protease